MGEKSTKGGYDIPISSLNFCLESVHFFGARGGIGVLDVILSMNYEDAISNEENLTYDVQHAKVGCTICWVPWDEENAFSYYHTKKEANA